VLFIPSRSFDLMLNVLMNFLKYAPFIP
jgi:hypothetical protein